MIGQFFQIDGIVERIQHFGLARAGQSADQNEKPADGVVGSNTRPDVFRGKVMVSGSFTGYFDSLTLADAFRNETSVSLLSVLSTNTTGTADFMSV